jgi:5'-3' exonuclease
MAVAFDHGSNFSNELSPAQTGGGIDPCWVNSQRSGGRYLGSVWLMVGSRPTMPGAAARFSKSKALRQVVICSPDKDLAQLVSGKRIVCWDRRRELVIDEAAVVQKFGVKPASIPDWLALVGDSADGYPGLPGWGEKSAAAVLQRFKNIESIPDDATKWRISALSPGRRTSLAASLAARRPEAMLYRKLARLRQDVPLKERLTDLQWRGASNRLKALCRELGEERLLTRIPKWRKGE